MIGALHAFFAAAPLAAIALSLALGYLCGKLRVGTFVLGPVAATLLVAILIGQVGVPVSGDVKTLAFALFIYALGYMIGPQFVGSLGRATLKQAHLTLLSSVVVVLTVRALAKGFGLDKGTAAGVLAGDGTESAVIGTASEAITSLPLQKEEIARLTANIGVAYAITYLFGTFTGSPHGRAGSCAQRLDHGLECAGRRSRPMVVRSLKRMATAALLAALALPAPGAALEIPPRKVEINKFTCGEFSSLPTGEERDRVLIYMNGYLDGTRKTAVWDAGQVGKRVDEVLRLCREDPKLTVINAFKRAWRQ